VTTTIHPSLSNEALGTPVRIGNRWHFANGKSCPVVSGADHDTSTVVMPELAELEDKIKGLSGEADRILEEAKTPDGLKLANVKGFASAADAAARFTELQAELTDLAAKAAPYRVAKAAAISKLEREKAGLDRDPGEPGDGNRKGGDIDPRYKSLSEAMKSAGLLKADKKGELEWDLKAHIDGLKTLFQTSAGWAPEAVRGPRLVDLVSMPFQELLGLIPTTRTNQNAVKYMRETTATSNAAETAEGAQKPEDEYVVVEDDSLVRKIATTIPVTDEQFDDEPRAEDYINNRLTRGVLERLAGQIINGDGVGVNLLGWLNDPGIQTQAVGADPVPDAVYRAMVKVMTIGGAFPNAYVTNPTDWADVRLLRTLDGIYIWGSPSAPGPDTIWGLRVVKLQQAPLNTGLVADWTYSELAIRKDLAIDTGYVNNQFRENKKTVRAELRAALMFYRPEAGCEVTGV
jgi:HK97 family phage major capsid protein